VGGGKEGQQLRPASSQQLDTGQTTGHRPRVTQVVVVVAFASWTHY